MNDTLRIRSAIAEWAEDKPLVNRAWIFGSRVRGDHRDDSDIDVAVELDMHAIRGIDGSGGFATWSFESKTWTPELEAILGLAVDLQYYRTGETKIIQSALDRSSVLAYEKQSSPISICQTP